MTFFHMTEISIRDILGDTWIIEDDELLREE